MGWFKGGVGYSWNQKGEGMVKSWGVVWLKSGVKGVGVGYSWEVVGWGIIEKYRVEYGWKVKGESMVKR